MSYILDSLRKAEQKRQTEDSFKTSLLFGDPVPVRKKIPFRLYLFFALLLFNGIAMILFVTNPWSNKNPDKTIFFNQNNMFPQSVGRTLSSGSTVQQTQTSLNESSKITTEVLSNKKISEKKLSSVPKTTTKEAMSEEQIPVDKAANKKNRLTEKIAEEKVVTQSKKRLFSLNELPSNIKDGLPTFKISGHAYSPNRQNRVTRVNEKILQEGEELSAGLKVEEITPEGIVFNHQGYRFLIKINENR